MQQVSSNNNSPFEGHREEIVQVSDEGDQVLLRWLGSDRWVETQHVQAIQAGPRITSYGLKLLMACIWPSNVRFGTMYCIDKKVDKDIVMVQLPGQWYISKANPQIAVKTSDWVEVLPSQK